LSNVENGDLEAMTGNDVEMANWGDPRVVLGVFRVGEDS
jgi:hypothetical protein